MQQGLCLVLKLPKSAIGHRSLNSVIVGQDLNKEILGFVT